MQKPSEAAAQLDQTVQIMERPTRDDSRAWLFPHIERLAIGDHTNTLVSPPTADRSLRAFFPAMTMIRGGHSATWSSVAASCIPRITKPASSKARPIPRGEYARSRCTSVIACGVFLERIDTTMDKSFCLGCQRTCCIKVRCAEENRRT